MDLERDLTSLFAIGLPGPEPSEDALRMIRQGVRGVVLFSRNVQSPDQVARLCRNLKAAAPGPLLIAIDQEGGRVARLRDGFIVPPPMRSLGRTCDADLARATGRLLGAQLRSVGIDLDFAPVLDVDTNPQNPVIGNRSLGSDPDLVSRLGAELIHGLQETGVAACGKHFPGHGDTLQDSHHNLPRLPHAMDRLDGVELPPFRAAIAAEVAAIMTAHVIFEQLDPDVPATMSKRVIQGLLREQLGFDGVVMSDDLEMKAIARHYGEEAAVLAGIGAGVDLFLCCHEVPKVERCIAAAAAAVERGDLDPAVIAAAQRRLDALAQQYVQPPADRQSIPTAELATFEATVDRIADAAPSGSPGPDPTDFRRSRAGH